MNKFLVFITSFISLTAIAQEPAPIRHADDFKKYSIGFNFSSDMAFRSLVNNDGTPNTQNRINTANAIEQPKFGYTTGFNICRNISNRFSLETGLQFSNNGHEMKMRASSYILEETTPTTGTVVSNIPFAQQTIFNYYYLDVPLKANLIFGQKNLRFITSAGAVVNILMAETNKDITIDDSGNKKNSTHTYTTNYNKVNLSPMISAGIDYKLCSKINLRVEPTFRYGLFTTIDGTIHEHLWTAGLNASCYYSL